MSRVRLASLPAGQLARRGRLQVASDLHCLMMCQDLGWQEGCGQLAFTAEHMSHARTSSRAIECKMFFECWNYQGEYRQSCPEKPRLTNQAKGKPSCRLIASHGPCQNLCWCLIQLVRGEKQKPRSLRRSRVEESLSPAPPLQSLFEIYSPAGSSAPTSRSHTKREVQVFGLS